MTAQAGAGRLPMSVMTSLSLHAAAVGAYLYLANEAKKHQTRVISNVDLMIQVHKPVALPKPIARTPTPPSTWNFLKMALPSVPKASIQPLNLKLPEPTHKVLQVQPKLQDKGRANAGPKFEKLDMDHAGPAMATIDSKLEAHHIAKLAAMPRLEEVGTRRVRNLPQALALEESRQQAVGLQHINALNAAAERHGVAAMGAPLQEAAGGPAPSSGFAGKIASMLPSSDQIDMRQGRLQTIGTVKEQLDTPVPKQRRADALREEKKKGVEIEGPLADRKVVAYDVPEFPSWAKDQGILEASVAIRFWVNPEGEVLPNMRVERTSGYGRLDRLAMDSLKNWKFAPISRQEKQWGVITFRFVLE